MAYVAFISYKHSAASRPHAAALEAALKRVLRPGELVAGPAAQLQPGVRPRVSSDTPCATIGDRVLVAENEPEGGASAFNLRLNRAAPAR